MFCESVLTLYPIFRYILSMADTLCDPIEQWLAQVSDSAWPPHVRVLACLQLHSTRSGEELCLNDDGSLLRRVDIARLTGLHEANVRRALVMLEALGFCSRVSTDLENPALRRDRVSLMCWKKPLEHR